MSDGDEKYWYNLSTGEVEFGMLSAALAIIGLVRLLQGQAGFGAAFLFAAFVSVVVSYALVRSVNASRQRPAGQRRPDGQRRTDGQRRPDGRPRPDGQPRPDAQPGRGDDRRR